MVFQKATHPSRCRFSANVAFGLRLSRRISRSKLGDRVEEALRDAAMWEEVKDKLHEDSRGLSGGQQQQLYIARAPWRCVQKVILFDEPTAALDPISTLRVEETLQSLRESYCLAIVTHNLQQAARVSNVTAFALTWVNWWRSDPPNRSLPRRKTAAPMTTSRGALTDEPHERRDIAVRPAHARTAATAARAQAHRQAATALRTGALSAMTPRPETPSRPRTARRPPALRRDTSVKAA